MIAENVIIDSSDSIYDPMTIDAHNTQYEQAIRTQITDKCHSCERFLFHEQCYGLRKHNKVSTDMALPSHTVLCSTCHRSILSNKVPPISVHFNFLSVHDPPLEITCLNKFELQLLPKIKVFMKMIILPGGQYAKQGLLLNLPVNTTILENQLLSLTNHSLCAVHYEAGSPHVQSTQVFINPKKVKAAFDWLRQNNHLYKDDIFPINTNDTLLNSSLTDNETDVSLGDEILNTALVLNESSLIPLDYPIPDRLHSLASMFLSQQLSHYRYMNENMEKKVHSRIYFLKDTLATNTTDLILFLHQCIDYKLAVTAFRAKHGLAPDYINELALPHSVSRTLRSTGANLLHVPKSNIVKGDRAFMIAGPRVWNSLPSNIRAITNLLDFKKKLKTFFYRKAFM